MFGENEYTLFFQADVQEEINEHFYYYESQAEGLGQRFLDEL